MDSQQHAAEGPVGPVRVVSSSLSPSAQQPSGTRPVSAEQVNLVVRPARLQQEARWPAVPHCMLKKLSMMPIALAEQITLLRTLKTAVDFCKGAAEQQEHTY